MFKDYLHGLALGVIFLSPELPTNVGASVIQRQTLSLHYRAFGDSFSAGPGAGKVSWWGGVFDSCKRGGGSYPQQLYKMLGLGDILPAEDFISCTGDTAEQIQQQILKHMDNTVDIATVSLGGNNVGFANIINNCVYRFVNTVTGQYSRSCDRTLGESQDMIANNLEGPVQAALQELLNRAKPGAQLFVTGYARFWNTATTQCNDANWSYFRNVGTPHLMTQDFRTTINNMVDEVNARLNKVVDGLGDSRLHFVNYEPYFVTEHFCESDNIIEPQKDGVQRLELLFGQYNTPVGQFQPDDGYVVSSNDDPYMEFITAFRDAIKNETLQVNTDNYAPITEDMLVATSGSLLIPNKMARVFHPTQKGHGRIAQAVFDLHNSLSNPAGTNFHVNKDCVDLTFEGYANIVVHRCAIDGTNGINIADQGTDNISAKIWGCFSTYMGTAEFPVPTAGPKCVLDAVWPRNLKDVFFGDDNCLYDGDYHKINDQCAENFLEGSLPGSDPTKPVCPQGCTLVGDACQCS